MTDYGHDLLFGAFVTPSARTPRHVLDLAIAADRAGLDLVTFQDHPYQSRFLDTWTLLSFVAAQTGQIHFSGKRSQPAPAAAGSTGTSSSDR
jgi:alkanesulfonate monooxygenase SsuD/methylene tetrahydromethanopterin reductase-like flavin-dependent oxidoreductase (luciferase family)